MSLINNRSVLYILPAAAELMYISELNISGDLYLDDLITYAIAYLDNQYERCIEDVIYDDLYDYFSLMHATTSSIPYMGPDTLYGAQTLHEKVSAMANSAMMLILNISSALAPLIGRVLEHVGHNSLRFRSAAVHKGDLVVIYDNI